MKKSLHALLLALSLAGLSACRQSDTVTADETARVNDPNPAVFLAGEYKAVELRLPDGSVQGRSYDYEPSYYIQGDYTCRLTAKGTDSVTVVVNGTNGPGAGPVLNQVSLGTFGIVAKPLNAADKAWQLRRSPTDTEGPVFIRKALPDKTVFQTSLTLLRVTDPKAADYGRIYPYDVRTAARANQIAYLFLARVSTGIVR